LEEATIDRKLLSSLDALTGADAGKKLEEMSLAARSGRYAMLRNLLLTVCLIWIAGCRSAPLPVWFEGLEKPRWTRVNLRTTDWIHLRSSNILTHPYLIPAGSQVSDIEMTSRWVRMLIDKRECTLYPAGDSFDATVSGAKTFLDKYFVESKDEVDPESLAPPALVKKLSEGKVAAGMTKEQVYVALGPPQWIDEREIETVRLSRERILESDRWTYIWKLRQEDLLQDVVPFPKKIVYVFEEGKLLRMED
jgi:hypothetical protein